MKPCNIGEPRRSRKLFCWNRSEFKQLELLGITISLATENVISKFSDWVFGFVLVWFGLGFFDTEKLALCPKVGNDQADEQTLAFFWDRVGMGWVCTCVYLSLCLPIHLFFSRGSGCVILLSSIWEVPLAVEGISCGDILVKHLYILL